MRRAIIVGISVLVSALFLWLALRDVPLAQVVEGIQGADLTWIIVSIFGVIGAQWTRTVRWMGLLDNRIPLRDAFHILNITMLLNQIPLRMGEVARSLLATRSGVPFVTAATSIVVERLIDVIAVVLMLAFSLSRLPDAPPLVGQTAALFGAAAVIGFAALLALARYPAFAHRILGAIDTRMPFLKRINLIRRFEEILDGLRPLTHARRAAHAIGWTIFAWSFSLLTFYALERALDVQAVDLLLASMIGVPLVAFSIAIPVTVAGLGPFQGAVRVTGEAVGMSAVQSTALGFIFHGITVLCYAAMGVIGLLAQGVSLRSVLSTPQEQP